ncbi:cuticle protein CP1499-like [Palaemon carinicauda]|uniref:cuticle protein CP1499-like n=1 Tax=Palaemon carinicauda TaxID=392227 RepID=UPI0035B606D7
MKTLVVLAIFGVCVAFARYTPEVEQAREEFFRAFRAAERASRPDLYTPEVRAAREEFFRAFKAAERASSPDLFTPEVQQAREEFFRAFRAAERAASPASPVQTKWYGPFAASQPAGLPGSPDQVPFTAEVQAAADAFQRAYRKQLEAVGRK